MAREMKNIILWKRAERIFFILDSRFESLGDIFANVIYRYRSNEQPRGEAQSFHCLARVMKNATMRNRTPMTWIEPFQYLSKLSVATDDSQAEGTYECE